MMEFLSVKFHNVFLKTLLSEADSVNIWDGLLCDTS